MGRMMIATESFITNVGGIPETIIAGATLVDDEHELYRRYPQHFKVAETRFAAPAVEAATAAPGEKRQQR